MINAGVDQEDRDKVLGDSLQGMDIHDISPSEEDLHRALNIETAW
jgi:hypothetical protein